MDLEKIDREIYGPDSLMQGLLPQVIDNRLARSGLTAKKLGESVAEEMGVKPKTVANWISGLRKGYGALRLGRPENPGVGKTSSVHRLSVLLDALQVSEDSEVIDRLRGLYGEDTFIYPPQRGETPGFSGDPRGYLKANLEKLTDGDATRLARTAQRMIASHPSEKE